MKQLSFGLFAGALAAVVGLHISAAEAAKAKEKVVYSFCSQTNCTDGSTPYANLIDVNGTLYGTTLAGGANCISLGGCGTVFSLDLMTGGEKVVYSFCSQQSCTDGASPAAGLLNVNGTLYGVTQSGGSDNLGTVFSIDLATGAETVVHSFTGYRNDGEDPQGSLIDVGGTLYGTTFLGGNTDWGTVFSVDAATGAETIVYSFGATPTDGANPSASLLAKHHTLYGTTSSGGAYSSGTVFSYNLTTDAEVLYSFCSQMGCPDGNSPLASLIDVKGALYSTTPDGGAHNNGGTVFSLDPKTFTESVLYSFGNGTDGRSPDANLIDLKGIFYGTTSAGGLHGYGTVFSLDPAARTEKVLHSFGAEPDGISPNAGLLNVKGKLFGTAPYGGAYGSGTVFEIKP